MSAMNYPADETDLSADQMEAIMADAEEVEVWVTTESLTQQVPLSGIELMVPFILPGANVSAPPAVARRPEEEPPVPANV